MTAARLAAARALVRIERGRSTLAAEVDRARAGLADARDRALLLELVGGVERWRLALDAAIARAANRRVGSIDPPVRAVLRLGAYQLRRLDRIPPHAVVHESVETVRALGAPRAAGFVNAVLRTLQRGADAVDLPPRPGPAATEADRVAYLSVTLSHPEWLARRWLARVGFEDAERWCLFNNAPPAVTVRAPDPPLMASLADAGIKLEPCRYVTDAWRLPPGALTAVPAALRGALRMQDEGSQLVALATGARPGDRVLDVCAAPGGKSIVMAGLMSGPGLIAADLRPARVALLRRTLDEAGVPAPVVRLDAARALPFGAVFDRVLLDAPCSGLGTLSRDPDLKWTRQEADLEVFARSQLAMLHRAADAVAPGGRLVYATCSSEPEENQAVVARFLSERSGFCPIRVTFGDAVRHAGELVDPDGWLATLPSSHGLDAFRAAVLARPSAA